jgi:antitoxin component of MazEF toxin-antitoxin module
MQKNIPKRKNNYYQKKIAKHGNQAIIVIPKILENQLKPKQLQKVQMIYWG